MTVEAAVILPLMLFFVIQLTSTIELLRLHGNIQTALWKYGRQAAVMGYLYQEVTEEEDQESLLYQIGEMTAAGLLTKAVILSDLGKHRRHHSTGHGDRPCAMRQIVLEAIGTANMCRNCAE